MGSTVCGLGPGPCPSASLGLGSGHGLETTVEDVLLHAGLDELHSTLVALARRHLHS